MFPKVIEILDSVLSWLERTTWGRQVIATVLGVALTIWAYLTTQFPPVLFAILPILLIGVTLKIEERLVPWLQKKLGPPFAIRVDGIMESPRDMQVPTFLINRSRHRRIAVEFSLCLRFTDGQKRWVLPLEYRGLRDGLGPEEHTKGMIVFSFGGPNDQDLLPKHERYLRVMDRVSSRSAQFSIPGSFPPHYFAPRSRLKA